MYSVTKPGTRTSSPKVDVSLSPLSSGPAARTVQFPRSDGSTVTFAQTFKDVVRSVTSPPATANAKGARATGSGSAIVIRGRSCSSSLSDPLIVFLVYRRRRRRRSVTPKDGGSSGREDPRRLDQFEMMRKSACWLAVLTALAMARASSGPAGAAARRRHISRFAQFRRCRTITPGLGMEAGHQAPGRVLWRKRLNGRAIATCVNAPRRCPIHRKHLVADCLPVAGPTLPVCCPVHGAQRRDRQQDPCDGDRRAHWSDTPRVDSGGSPGAKRTSQAA